MQKKPWNYIFILMLGLIVYNKALAYDTAAAIAYSDKWCNAKPGAQIGYNYWNNYDKNGIPRWDPTRYYNDYGIAGGGDCANFGSQCLIAGGLGGEIESYINCDFGPNFTKSWYFGYQFDSGHEPNTLIYDGVKNGGLLKTIANVCNFYSDNKKYEARMKHFLTSYYHARYIKGGTVIEDKIRDIMKPGDLALIMGINVSGRNIDHTLFLAAKEFDQDIQKDELLFNFHSYDAWHSSMTAIFNRHPIKNFNFFHLEPTVPRVEKVKIEELNPDNSVYRTIYQADRGVGGYPVLTDIAASGYQDLKITIEFNESIQFVRYKDTNNQYVQGIRLAEVDPNTNQILNEITVYQEKFKDNTGQTVWESKIVTLSELQRIMASGKIAVRVEAENYVDVDFCNNQNPVLAPCNTLDSNPATPTEWVDHQTGFDSNYESGPDETHKFNILTNIANLDVQNLGSYVSNGTTYYTASGIIPIKVDINPLFDLKEVLVSAGSYLLCRESANEISNNLLEYNWDTSVLADATQIETRIVANNGMTVIKNSVPFSNTNNYGTPFVSPIGLNKKSDIVLTMVINGGSYYRAAGGTNVFEGFCALDAGGYPIFTLQNMTLSVKYYANPSDFTSGVQKEFIRTINGSEFTFVQTNPVPVEGNYIWSGDWDISGVIGQYYQLEIICTDIYGNTFTTYQNCGVCGTEAVDTQPPTNPTSCYAWKSIGKEKQIFSDTWYNWKNGLGDWEQFPNTTGLSLTSGGYFEWYGASDNAPGSVGVVKGYYVYFGPDPNGQPSGSLLPTNNLDLSLQGSQWGYNYLSGINYFRISTEDWAGNISVPETLFIYKRDTSYSVLNYDGYKSYPSNYEQYYGACYESLNWHYQDQTPDVSIKVKDMGDGSSSGAGLNPQSAAYAFRVAGQDWSDWIEAECTGSNGSQGEETITAKSVPFYNNGGKNFIKFRISDMVGNEVESRSISIKINDSPVSATNLLPGVGGITGKVPMFKVSQSKMTNCYGSVSIDGIGLETDVSKLASKGYFIASRPDYFQKDIDLSLGKHSYVIYLSDYDCKDFLGAAYSGIFPGEFYVIDPVITINTDKSSYKLNENMKISVDIAGTNPTQSKIFLKTLVRLNDNIVYEDNRACNYPDEVTIINPVQSYFPEGSFYIETYVYSDASQFELIKYSNTKAIPNLIPYVAVSSVENIAPMGVGDNTLRLKIRNFIDADCALWANCSFSGSIYKYYGQTLVDFSTSNVVLANLEEKAFEFNCPIQKIEFGKYTLSGTLTSEYGTFPYTKGIYCQDEIKGNFNKAYYKINDPMVFDLKIINTGVFPQNDMKLTVSIPGCDFTQTETIDLACDQILEKQYTAVIPEGDYGINHVFKVRVKLELGDSYFIKEFDYYVNYAELTQVSLTTNKDSYVQGEAGTAIFTFDPGTELTLGYDLVLLGNSKHIYDQSTGQITIPAHSEAAIPFTMPSQVPKGWYTLKIICTDEFNHTKEYIKSVYLSDGYDNNLRISLPRWSYLSSEPVNIAAVLANSQNLNQYALEIKVYPYQHNIQNYTTANGLSDNGICQVVADYNDVWLETGNMIRDINRFNLSENKFYTYAGILGGGNGRGAAIGREYIWWTTGAGAARFNKNAEAFDMMISSSGQDTAFSVDSQDSNILWTAGMQTIKRYNQLTGETIYYDNTQLDYISCLANDQSAVWAGSYNGVYKLDTQTQIWTQYSTSNGLPDNTINDIKIENSNVWIATNNGLAKYDQTNNQWSIYKKENGLKSDQVKALVIDGSYLWAIGEGLSRYNLKTGQWTSYGASEGIINSPTTASGDTESIWLGSYGVGLQRIKTTGDIIKTSAISPGSSNFNIDLGSFNTGEYVVIATLRTTSGDIISQVKENFSIGDNLPPVTQIQILDPKYQAQDKTYINQNSKIELAATDTGAGLDKINYRIDAGTTTVYTEPFSVSLEGMHTLYYYAIDKMNNVEAEKNYVLYVDTTTPETSFKITDASYEITEGTNTYVNSRSTFTISAIDPLSNNVSSGVKQMRYKIDSDDYVIINSTNSYLLTPNLSMPDGVHTISYYAMDNVANTETVKTYTAIFDGTKPQLKSTYPANNAKVKIKNDTSIKIVFSEQVVSTDWSKDIIINANKTNATKDFNISYDSTTYTVTIDGKLKKNTQYDITLKNTITDRVKNYMDEYKFSFQTILEAKTGGIITDTVTGLTLIIPPNALPCDGYFEINLIQQTNPPKLPKPLQWLLEQRKAYQIIFYDQNGNIVEEQVKKAFAVVIILKNQWIALAQSQPQIDPKTLKVYQIGSVREMVLPNGSQAISQHESKSQFAPILMSESSYDPQEETITVEVSSFGIFNLAGFNAPGISLDDLSCYPNPFNPCKQDITIQYYLINDTEVAIAIYDLLGNLVKTWEIPAGEMNARTGLNQLAWNGRNGSGDIVANGGYILFVHSDDQKKKFKILVVK